MEAESGMLLWWVCSGLFLAVLDCHKRKDWGLAVLFCGMVCGPMIIFPILYYAKHYPSVKENEPRPF